MDERRWSEQLKERADRSIFRDVHFTPQMMEGVRTKIAKNPRIRRNWFMPLSAAALSMLVLLWQLWPSLSPTVRNHASTSPPSLLSGGGLEPSVLWSVSPRTDSVYDNQPFSYMGQKPVRIITAESGFYEGQQQRVVWLLDGDFTSTVELVAYSAEGEKIPLGSYQVMGALYDAKGHFPSGIVLPRPGIWKLQVLSGGVHMGEVFVQVNAGISPANEELVVPLIRSYLETEGEKLGWIGDDRQITLELLGVEAPNAEQRKVYAWVKVLSKNPRLSSGISAPMVFDIEYDGKEYRVKGFQQPEDGSNYQSSLQRLFPPKVLEKIKGRQ